MWKVSLGLLIVFLSGCAVIRSENKVYGHYDLITGDVKVHLDVTADHSYSEAVEFTNGNEQRNVGKWQWMDGQACFVAFLVPKTFMKNLLENVPTAEQPKTIRNTYQLDRCLPAEVLYGKTTLEINPDSPENFVMISSPIAR